MMQENPLQITTDGHSSYPQAIHEVLGPKVTHRCNAYLNRRIEQDHRGIKQRYYPMLGFGSLPSGRRFCRAFEEVRQYFRPRRKRKLFVSLTTKRQSPFGVLCNPCRIRCAGRTLNDPATNGKLHELHAYQRHISSGL